MKIDYYAYSSGIRSWNASFKVLFSMIVLLFCIIADNLFVSFTVVLTMAFFTIGKGKVRAADYVRLMTVPLAFMILGSIAIAVGFSKEVAGDYGIDMKFFYLYTSRNGIKKCLEVFMKAWGAVSAMYLMTLSTPASELILVLRKAHIPKVMVELMNMIYRFIFIMLEVQEKMKISAQSRLGYVDFKTSCKSFGNTASNLLVVSLRKANAYYDAMISRCYDGEFMFLEEEKPVTWRQIAGAAVYLMGLIVIWQLPGRL
ncbi:MAG: cobalt ECF transporter T component CbiQ [Clostridiaceae bacterium]|nr:cobalt ECF transporter T component CbiQ [Clostridiaceae bacterium]